MDAMERHDGTLQNALVIPPVLKLKGDQRIDGYSIWSCLSFIFYNRYGSTMQANRVMLGEEWMSVRNDGMSKMIPLYSI